MLTLLALAALLDVLRAADARVANVAWHLQTANAASCRDVVLLPGFAVETLDQYAVAQRGEARAQLGLGNLPQISAVVPDSIGAKAALRVGDEIVAVDDVPMPQSQGGKPTYESTAAVETALAIALAKPPLKLTLASRTVLLTGDAGCASTVQLVTEAKFDASADGHYVQISGPMYEFAQSDANLAFLIAHELAHNLFPQAKRVPRGGAGQRAAELAADQAAIWMMARAGYDIGGAASFLQRLGRKRALSWLDGSHPRWALRIKAVSEAVEEIRGRQTTGKPLTSPFDERGTRANSDR